MNAVTIDILQKFLLRTIPDIRYVLSLAHIPHSYLQSLRNSKKQFPLIYCKYIRLLFPQNEFAATLVVCFCIMNGKMSLSINRAFVWLEF